jgi:hypothetical protein
VAHPDLEARAHPAEEPLALGDVDPRSAELALVGPPDLAAEQVRHQLHAVADAEHRHALAEDAGIDGRRPVGVHARGPTGEDQALRAADHLRPDGRGHDLRVAPLLADAPRDQLGVLAAEVDDEHPLVAREAGLARRGPGRAVGGAHDCSTR